MCVISNDQSLSTSSPHLLDPLKMVTPFLSPAGRWTDEANTAHIELISAHIELISAVKHDLVFIFSAIFVVHRLTFFYFIIHIEYDASLLSGKLALK